MRRKIRKSLQVVFVLFLIFFPCLISATPQEKQQIFRHEAAAVIKLVSVRVLDQYGRPVTDLKKEDFILYDNGAQMKITEFEVHGIGAKTFSPGAKSFGSENKACPEMNRKFFIFFDIQGNDEIGMANSKKAALHFIETQLMPGDEVGVLSYSPLKGLSMEEYLTSDKEKIKKAIQRAREIPLSHSPGGIVGKELDDAEKEAGKESRNLNVKSEDAPVSAFGLGRVASKVEGLHLLARKAPDFRMTMSELAEALRFIPGNKSILLFSTGTGESIVRKETGKNFTSANAPVFAINTIRWKTGAYQAAEKWEVEHSRLKDFAFASGGKYFEDVQDVKSIAEDIQSLTNHYYVVGYYISQSWDGQYHKIKVEVKRPGCRILSQDGYYNPKPFSQRPELEKNLELYDLIYSDRPASQNFLDMPIEPLFPLGDPTASVLLMSRLDVSEKTGIPPGKAELFMYLFDSDNKVVKAERGELDLTNFNNRTLYPYYIASLSPGKYEYRTLARDMETGQSVLGRSFFQIPDPASSAIALYSPLLLMPGQEPVYLKLSASKKENEKSATIVHLYPLLTKECVPLVGTLKGSVKNLWAIVPVRLGDLESPQVDLTAQLIRSSTGERISLDSEIVDSKEYGNKMFMLLMALYIPPLRDDDYELEISAKERRLQHPFTIKTFFKKK